VELIQRGEELDSICMWSLNEGQDTAEWGELHDMFNPERPHLCWVVANNGWTVMVDKEMEIYLCNSEKKLTKKISLPR